MVYLCLSAPAPLVAQVTELYKNQGAKIPSILVPSDWNQEGVPKTSLLNFSSASRIKGYAIYERDYMDLKNQNFPKEETRQIQLSVTQGEYEPFVIAIFASEDLNEIKISTSDLVTIKDVSLDKDNIDIRIVSNIPRKANKKQCFTLEPILLERFNTLVIKKNEHRIFWFTIFIPPGTPPGDYIGKIYITPSNKAESSISLKINVLPFALQNPPLNFGIYYNIDNRWKGFYPKNLRKDLIDIREHGLDNVAIFFAPKINFENNKLNVDFSKGAYCSPFSFDEFMAEYLKAGFNAPAPFLGAWYPLLVELEKATKFTLYTEEFDKYYVEAIKLIEEHRKKKEWPEFLYSPEDEPANDEEKMKKAKHYLPLIKKAVPYARTYLTLNGLRKGLNEGKEFDSWLDVRCYAFFNESLIAETLSIGDEFWIYNGGSEAREKAFLDRYFYGFFAMKAKVKGVTQWVYQWPISLKSTPHNELFEQKDQGWYYTYPSYDGPVPTQHWEVLREGIDDAKYIYTLEQFIKQAKDSHEDKIMREAEISEMKLNATMSKIDVYHHIPEESESARRIFGYDLSPEKAKIMDEWRKQIKEETLKLYNLLENAKK